MLSHPHRALFVHIPKTGGQSLEIMFLRDLGLGWDDRAVLLLRPNDNPRLGPPALAHLTYREYAQHYYATDAMLAEYFTCAIVRHPLDRAFSLYRYLGDCAQMSFDDWLAGGGLTRRWEKSHWFVRPQHEFVSGASGDVGVDYVGRFEQLAGAAEHIAASVGLRDATLPHVNVSHFDLRLRLRTDWRRALHPRALRKRLATPAGSHCTDPSPRWADVSPAARSALLSRYAADFEVFGYEPDAGGTRERSG